MTFDKEAILAKSAEEITVDELRALLKADRLARRMTWKDYAAFLGVPQSTTYKIATKFTTRPHQTTVDQILQVIRLNPVQGVSNSAVVSD